MRGGTNQHQLAQPARRQPVDVDPAYRALAELEWPLEADELGREVAEVGLVADQRHAWTSRQARDFGNHRGVSAARRQRVDDLHARLAWQAVGQQIRGLPASDQRAREDDVDLDAEGGHPGHALAKFRRAVRRERPHGVVGPLGAALGGHGVAYQIQLQIAQGCHLWRDVALMGLRSQHDLLDKRRQRRPRAHEFAVQLLGSGLRRGRPAR